MTEKNLENIMTVDDEAALSLSKALSFLSSLSLNEEDTAKRACYSKAMHLVSKAMESLTGVLLLEYPDLEDDELEDGLEEPMSTIVSDLKDENPDVQNAYAAMIKRGESPEHANQEIGRAFSGCLWEQNKGLPDRFQEVFAGLAAGKSSVDLFPDALYATDNETTN